MKNLVCCIICRKEFSKNGIFTHYDRSHLMLKKYSSGNNGKYSNISKLFAKRKIAQELIYNSKPNKCCNCNKLLNFNKRKNKFCSRQCAGHYNNEERKRIGWKHPNNKKIVINSSCLECGNVFEHNNKKRKFCTKSCACKFKFKEKNLIARKNRSALTNYRSDCSFKFSIKQYPEEFDLSLIEKYGWYKAKNRGNNLTGISRDHMVSVRYGFDNNISSEHLSHPANCRLIRHNENISKGKKNFISYNDLLIRIENWNKKYHQFGPVV